MRRPELNKTMAIHFDGKEEVETVSEKLLGVIINNELTWKHHLYGDDENEGLIPQQDWYLERTLIKNESRKLKTLCLWPILLKTKLLFAIVWKCVWA